MRWNSKTTLCKKVTRLFHFQFSFMFIEACQQLPQATKQSKGLKRTQMEESGTQINRG
jgi:hypothetical protein